MSDSELVKHEVENLDEIEEEQLKDWFLVHTMNDQVEHEQMETRPDKG